MAIIRPQMVAPVDFSGSNRLLELAQRQLSGGLGGLGDIVTGLRNEAIKRNTANAVGTLLGAQNSDDLASRQQQVASMLQQYGNDVDPDAVNRAAATMPDTLLSRTSNQLQVTNQQNQLADQSLAGDAWARIAQGDYAGAAQIAQGMNDPSKVISAGLDAQARNQQLALQRQSMNQSAANASSAATLARDQFDWRKEQAAAEQERNDRYIQQLIGGSTGAGGARTTAAGSVAGSKDVINNALAQTTQFKNQSDVATGAKNNLSDWASANDGFWSGKVGTKLRDVVGKLPGFNDLPPAYQKNALDIGLKAYSANSGLSNLFSQANPEAAAVEAVNTALAEYSQTQQKASTLQNMSNSLEEQQRQQQMTDSLLRQLLRR